MRTAITFSLPSAWVARWAVTAESTPPERPTTAFSNPRRSNSSRRKETSHPAASSASIASGGGPARESLARITGIGSLPLWLASRAALRLEDFSGFAIFEARELFFNRDEDFP